MFDCYVCVCVCGCVCVFCVVFMTGPIVFSWQELCYCCWINCNIVELVVAAPACCLLPAVVLPLDLNILLLFFLDGDAVVAQGGGRQG